MIIDADGHTHIPHEVFDNYMEKEFTGSGPAMFNMTTAVGST